MAARCFEESGSFSFGLIIQKLVKATNDLHIYKHLTATDEILPATLESITREKFTLSWLEGNIFKIDIHENAYVDVDDLKEIQMHKAALTKNQLHGVLFITPRFGNLSKEGREYSASPEASMNCICKAVITSNLGMRILTNFFITINRPVVPHHAFSDTANAVKWLQQKLQEAGIGGSAGA